MKLLIFTLLISLSFISMPIASFAQEQKPGKPLYFDPNKYGGHPSDLAPETDPKWEQEKARREASGQSLDELYQEPPEIIREERIYYQRVDKKKKGSKAPSRWDH